MRYPGNGSGTRLSCLILLLLGSLCPPIVTAQSSEADVAFSTIACARSCTALLEHDGYVYAGLLDGGIMAWNLDDPDDHFRITGTDGLADLHVTDLDWSGRHLWAATEKGGLTRIDLDASPRRFRQYTGDPEATSVAGYVQEDLERVFYAIPDGGLGVISGGLGGTTRTTANTPGLASNTIMDLEVHGTDLWIGTDRGVSVLSDNVFADISDGMSHTVVLDMIYMDGMGLVVSDLSGLEVYDPLTGGWSDMASPAALTVQLERVGDTLWALAAGTGPDRLSYWDGTDWVVLPMNDPASSRIAGGSALHAVGTHFVSTFYDKAAHVFLDSYDGAAWRSWSETTELTFDQVAGVDIDGRGRVWLGAHAAGGIASLSDGVLHQITEVASAENDSIGLFNNDANILDIVSTANGDIWVTQYAFQAAIKSGLIRYRPDTPLMEHLTPDNSSLPGKRYTGLAAHPAGPLLMLSDLDGVSVLIDPARWRDPGQWLDLPTGSDGLSGVNVLDVGFDGPDRVWFAVKLVGLVLWDINGAAGPDAELTWTDTSDDVWLGPIDAIPERGIDLTGMNSVEVAADGTLWIGGSGGVEHVSADIDGGSALDLAWIESFGQKITSAIDGLLNESVMDLAFDRNGDLWVAHEAGLDRIRFRGTETHIDAYTSVGVFNDFNLGDLYFPDIIVGLPPSGVFSLAASGDGSRMVGGTRYGAVLMDIPEKPDSGGPLDALFLWPNPFLPLEHAGLRIGGTDAVVDWQGYVPFGGAGVEIYNLQGQIVFRDSHVDGDTVFWDGLTLDGSPVASGQYLVRVEYGGQIAVMPLAVVF